MPMRHGDDLRQTSSGQQGKQQREVRHHPHVVRPRDFGSDTLGPLVYGDMRCLFEAARQGVALAFVFCQFAEDSMRRGESMALLERHCTTADTFHQYYPHRARMPGELRAFIDLAPRVRLRRPSKPASSSHRGPLRVKVLSHKLP